MCPLGPKLRAIRTYLRNEPRDTAVLLPLPWSLFARQVSGKKRPTKPLHYQYGRQEKEPNKRKREREKERVSLAQKNRHGRLRPAGTIDLVKKCSVDIDHQATRKGSISINIIVIPFRG